MRSDKDIDYHCLMNTSNGSGQQAQGAQVDVSRATLMKAIESDLRCAISLLVTILNDPEVRELVLDAVLRENMAQVPPAQAPQNPN